MTKRSRRGKVVDVAPSPQAVEASPSLAVATGEAPAPDRIKDFPSAARFTARQVALSVADDTFVTQNRAERRRRATATRLNSRGLPKGPATHYA